MTRESDGSFIHYAIAATILRTIIDTSAIGHEAVHEAAGGAVRFASVGVLSLHRAGFAVFIEAEKQGP